MGSKVTVDDITNVTNSSGVPTINENFDAVADEFDLVHYRDGSQAATDDWDMNSNRILNLPDGLSSGEPFTVRQLEDIVAILSAGDESAQVAAEVLARIAADALIRSDLADDDGSELLGYLLNRAGAVGRTVNERLGDVVSVKDFGAVGDSVTDDLAAIQAAFDSGASKVIIPKGVYTINGNLTVPDWLQIEGEGYQPGIGGSGRSVEFRFVLDSGAALTCGFQPTIRNIFFQNLDGSFDEYHPIDNPTGTNLLTGTTARAIVLTHNAVIEDCCFSLWDKCIETGADTFYLNLTRPHFNRCSYGIFAPSTTPYNLNINQPHSVLTSVFLAGDSGAYPRNVKVFGGSIEGYNSVAVHFQDITFFGTYFETETPRSAVTAIDPGLNKSNVSLFGCHINVQLTSRFVNMSGLTGCSLVSYGNLLYGEGPAASYYMYLPTTGSVTAGGDNFQPDDATPQAATYLYVDSIASAQRFNIDMPLLPAGNTHVAYSGMKLINSRGFSLPALTAAPANPVDGMVVRADNATWDPLARAGTNPYYTQYSANAGAWQSMDGGA